MSHQVTTFYYVELDAFDDQPLQKFKIWKAIVENYIGLQVKVLKTDNGLEFHNKEFDDYS